MSPPITAEEFTELVGEVDPAVVERVLESQASFDEVAEALAVIEYEETYGQGTRTASSPRVITVQRILAELVLDDAYEEDAQRGAEVIS